MKSPSTSPRLNGLLVSWRLSKSGGLGKVYVAATDQLYFLCRKFIVSGEPHVGCPVSFVPRPAAAGAKYPQATNAIVDNSRAVRALRLVTGRNATSRAVAILSGKAGAS